jgi:hypothetical protein
MVRFWFATRTALSVARRVARVRSGRNSRKDEAAKIEKRMDGNDGQKGVTGIRTGVKSLKTWGRYTSNLR